MEVCPRSTWNARLRGHMCLNVQVLLVEIIERIVNVHHDQGGTSAILHHEGGEQSRLPAGERRDGN
jgi:hypothetical protein